MARPASHHPTELELEILKVVWPDYPVTVRQVRDRLAEQTGRDLAYTSVMTTLGVMFNKGYLKRKMVNGSFYYEPKVAREKTLGKMLGDLVDRAFGGSPSAAVLNLLKTSDVDAEELRRIRELLDEKH
jgi:predicted transcriptional regulator